MGRIDFGNEIVDEKRRKGEEEVVLKLNFECMIICNGGVIRLCDV